MFLFFDSLTDLMARKSISYRRLYRFGQRYDIFQVPVNTGVPFRIYRYFLLFYTIYKVIIIFFDKHLVIMIILLVCLMFYIIL